MQLNQQFDVHNNMKKIRLSMKRLLTVVNERRRLRDSYRQYLENLYINEKKQEEIREKILMVSCHFSIATTRNNLKLNLQKGKDIEDYGELIPQEEYEQAKIYLIPQSE